MRAPWLALLAACHAVAAEDVAPGVRYERVVRALADGRPVVVHLLEIDPRHSAVNLVPVRALDRAAERETVSSMAARYGAIAAVNGGYFVVSGPYTGASMGVYQSGREILGGGRGRTALLLCREKSYREQVAMTVVNFEGTVRGPRGAKHVIAGIHRRREMDEMVLFRSAIGGRTRAETGGVEAVINPAGVVERLEESGDAGIPNGGAVLSASGSAAQWLREHAVAGTRLKIDVRVRPVGTAVCQPTDIVGGGPNLITARRKNVTAEGFAHQNVRHPRTALALTSRGTLLFVTVDGRQASSAGMTLEELAGELISQGAVEALNLDGGGSATLYAGGRVMNSPSDGRERAVSDAILIFSIPDTAALAAVVVRLGEGQIRHDLTAPLRERIEAAGRAEHRGDRRDVRRELGAALDLVRQERDKGISHAASQILEEAAATLRSR